jgi:hypothetical protein
MLKLLPALLLAIFVATIVFIVFRSRREIGEALSGRGPNCPSGDRSTCCNSEMQPYGWTADGWVALCKVCGNWQYLGDDHDNPPQGFNFDGSAVIRFAQSGGQIADVLGRMTAFEPLFRMENNPGGEEYGRFAGGGLVPLRSYRVGEAPSERVPPLPGERTLKMKDYAGKHTVDINFEPVDLPREFWDEIARRTALGMLEQALGRPLTAEELSEVTSCPYCDAPLPGPHAYDCPRRVASELSAESRMVLAHTQAALDADAGEPLVSPPQPNIGGEGHLPYSGPRYEDDELNQLPRHVPYDMLHNPIPGTGVFAVKGEDDDE